MQVLQFLVGLALIGGEFARRGESAFWAPKAFDDLLAGAVLLLLAVAGTRARPALHAAGWGLFTGVMLATLGITLDAWLTDATEARAGFYSAVVGTLVLIGAGATLWWARRR